MSQNKTVQISEIRQETADCKTFVLRSGDKIPYSAGQFLTFLFPKKGEYERRSYSFSSAPALGEDMAVTIKRVTNGEYSRQLVDNFKTGDTLITIGASGLFVLPDDMERCRQMIFLAAGSGITPVFSLIKTVLLLYPSVDVVLIYSNRSPSSTIFLKEIHALAVRYRERFRIEWLYSTNFNLSRARLGKWLLPELLKQYRTTGDEQTLFYVCGPFEYMRMIQIVLAEENFPASNIRREFFENVPLLTRVLPPDTEAHGLEIISGGQRVRVETRYPKTILREAIDAGIDIAYSCEAGRCGTCVATCESGQVWMRHNEVLLDEEITKGRVLTCVGYVIGGDAVVRL